MHADSRCANQQFNSHHLKVSRAERSGQPVQERVVRAMVLAGETALAEETREQSGLSKDTLDVDSAEAAAQRAITADTYLPLRLPTNAILFADDEAAVAR